MRGTRQTILFVHPSDELYGSDRCLLDIVTGLPERFRAVVVLPTDLEYSGALSHELEAAGATVERVDMLVLRRALLRPGKLPVLLKRLVVGTVRLARLIRREDAVLVHSNTVAVLCGASAAAVTRVPHLWHVHEHIGDEPLPFKALVRTFLTLLPGRIVANSRSVARAVVGGSRQRLRRIQVVENSVDPDIRPVDRSRPTDNRPVVIGVVGRLAPRKGTAEALEAAALLAGRGACFALRFAGDAPPGQEALQASYEEQVVALGLSDYVTFAGQVDDVPSFLAACDILLLPSQRPEPFGLVVIEGMASGLPVVATLNGGGSDEILDHGITGLYCGRDPLAIAAALERLVADRALRKDLGSAAAVVAARRYARTRYQRDFVRIYECLMRVSG